MEWDDDRFLKGTLFQMMSEAVVIETGGLGYEVQIHGRMAAQLPHRAAGDGSYFLQVGKRVKLYGFASGVSWNCLNC
jgi:Holliday junction resolvasome RuvABC DNA-binding subunit